MHWWLFSQPCTLTGARTELGSSRPLAPLVIPLRRLLRARPAALGAGPAGLCLRPAPLRPSCSEGPAAQPPAVHAGKAPANPDYTPQPFRGSLWAQATPEKPNPGPAPAPPQPRLSPASPLPPLRQRPRSPPTGGPNHRAQERGARALPRPAAACLTAARQCLYFLTPPAPARDGLGPQWRSLPPMGGRGGCARICARGAVRGAGPARERRRSGGAHPQP